MTRTDIINFLISERQGKSYLEIGVYNEDNNFNHIRCERKIGVDLNPITTFQGTSNEFFEQNQEEFDCVFIDSIHTEEQTLKDIGNARRCLSEKGIIILHDCMPPDEWHQRPLEYFKDGENWNGTVWKAALKVFNYTKYKCTLVDTDWGCGIIDTANRQVPLRRDFPDQLDYNIHYSELLEYKINVSDFIKGHVKVFFHLACMGNWKEVFNEQMTQLNRNGFNKINLTVLGSEQDLQVVKDIMDMCYIDGNIIFNSPDHTCFEQPAMIAIEEYARCNSGYVLYLHSKGVSNSSDINKMKWRRLMMSELVDNWRNCMIQLPHWDVIGVNWRTMPPTSHFSGNFWYASTDYLRKLADFKTYYDNPRYDISNSNFNKRLGCEFWIGSGEAEPSVLSLFCKNVDFCTNYYWMDKYL
jgi:Methyltransferase domain